MRSRRVNSENRENRNRNRRNRAALPRTCPINFDFSSTRIECKICEHFDRCLKTFIKAEKLAKGL
ncbi:MAG: hypothetical protein QXJ56_00215 [Ignisphaera sp.]|uniref:Uncharacterized protein n=1 Tax=Ignisphaera aggregans TaxID=334771 RepID=A0A7J3JRD2_9CREN